MTEGERTSVVADIRSRAHVFPRPYWLLVSGTFIYLVGYECGYPFETIYLHSQLGVSMTAVGLILGLCGLAGLPVQLVGGAVADRFGRRPVLIVAILASMTLFLGLALAQPLWGAHGGSAGLVAVPCAGPQGRAGSEVARP